MKIDRVTLRKVSWKDLADFRVVLAEAAIRVGTDIRFQFVDRLDCKAQTEDSRGQDRPGRMSRVRKYIC